MNIGSIIKIKRQQKDLTQEQFAEYLNVSVSAVSQWESGKNMPDASLLVPLAEFFDITLDELFGRTPGEKEKALAEYDRKSVSISNKGQVEEAISLWREALQRFPGDFHCMSSLAHSLFMQITAHHEAESTEEKAKEAVSLCERILRDCTVSNLRENAVQLLTYLYSSHFLSIADESKAVEYANMAGSIYFSREMLLEFAYFTEESRDKQIERKQFNRLWYLQQLTAGLTFDPNFTREEHLLALEAALKLWQTVIPDGNYLVYHSNIADIYTQIAKHRAEQQLIKEALTALENALFHADKCDNLPAREQYFTSVFLNKVSFDPRKTIRNYTKTHTEIVMDAARSFATLQEVPEYKAMIAQYQ